MTFARTPDDSAYDLCAGLYGGHCSCRDLHRHPCSAISMMVEEGEDVQVERDRIAEGIADAEEEIFD